jgi:hypothetical protein
MDSVKSSITKYRLRIQWKSLRDNYELPHSPWNYHELPHRVNETIICYRREAMRPLSATAQSQGDHFELPYTVHVTIISYCTECRMLAMKGLPSIVPTFKLEHIHQLNVKFQIIA